MVVAERLPTVMNVLRVDQVIEELITKSRGNVPDDMLALAATVLMDEDIQRVPPIHWRTNGKAHSRGRCSRERITVSIGSGSPAQYTPLVVIHELTHWMMLDESHSPFFYEKAFELYDRYGVDMVYAMDLEFNYKSYTAKLGYALYRRSIHGDRWACKLAAGEN